jgi:hypothetical protein
MIKLHNKIDMENPSVVNRGYVKDAVLFDLYVNKMLMACEIMHRNMHQEQIYF